jgi:hypothetical protein
MRSRLSLEARFEGGLRLFVQVQDVRDWGEETSNRDKTADAIDFHQAYLEVDRIPGVGGMIRAGRQEITLAERRFLAAPNWGQAGQTFDGIRWIRPLGGARLEMVYLRLQEASSPVHEEDSDLTAGWLVFPERSFGSLDFLILHDRVQGPEKTAQTTVGPIWKAQAGLLSLRVQGMLQLGRREGLDVSASMITLSGTVPVLDDRGSVTLWYDHLSGDGDDVDGELGSFSTLFGARHRFYGRGDYFTNIPVDTGNRGLRDAALKLSYAPDDLLALNMDLHAFRTANQGSLSSQRLGEEVDIWVQYQFRRFLAVELGGSLTWAGPAMEELELLEGTGTVGYVMTSLSF